MKSIALLVSVNYNDYLDFLLPINIKQFDKIIVLTVKSDKKCIEICKKYKKVKCGVFDDSILNFNQRKFNKGKLLNQGLAFLDKINYNGILTLTDADIMFPSNYKYLVNNIKSWKQKMYSLRRYDSTDKYKLKEYCKTKDPKKLNFYPHMWVGYCQIFQYNPNHLRFNEDCDADTYDMIFLKDFEKKCKTLYETSNNKIAGFESGIFDYLSYKDYVVHLGSPTKNHKGRVTENFFISQRNM